MSVYSSSTPDKLTNWIPRPVRNWLIALVFVLSVGGIACVPREHFGMLCTLYGFAFLSYICTLQSRTSWKFWVGIAVLARVLLIPAFPHLSDDIYRFFWDGTLVVHGLSPYLFTPEQFLQNAAVSSQLLATYPLLNSPGYYSVYPPVSQFFFTLCAFIAQGDVHVFSVCLKILFCFFECASIGLILLILQKLDRPPHLVLLYAANPLVLLEGVGNVHFEVLVIAFLLLTYKTLLDNRIPLSATALAAAIATKLTPALILPFLLRRLVWRRKILLLTVCGVGTIILLAPVFLSAWGNGFFQSVDLYFRKFEFNASVYYLMREIGRMATRFNTISIIGPVLACVSGLLILVLAVKEKQVNLATLPATLILAMTLYYAFATTVHPWYLLPMLALVPFTTLRFPLWWSGAIFLSYATYAHTPYHESALLIGLEYMMLITGLVHDRKSICALIRG